MMQETMSFGGWEWPCNPELLTVSYGRKLTESYSPYAGACLQDLGREKRVATGEGVFPGEEAQKRAAALAALCMQGGSRLLILPGHLPFYAVLASLELVSAPAPDGVRCRFVFWEDMRGKGGALDGG